MLGSSEPRSFVKVEVAVLGSLSLISLAGSVDGKQHLKKIAEVVQPHLDPRPIVVVLLQITTQTALKKIYFCMIPRQ